MYKSRATPKMCSSSKVDQTVYVIYLQRQMIEHLNMNINKVSTWKIYIKTTMTYSFEADTVIIYLEVVVSSAEFFLEKGRDV